MYCDQMHKCWSTPPVFPMRKSAFCYVKKPTELILTQPHALSNPKYYLTQRNSFAHARKILPLCLAWEES
jgi:hypothetical protein